MISNSNGDNLFQYFERTPYKMVFDYIMPKQPVITKIRLMVWSWIIQLFYCKKIKNKNERIKMQTPNDRVNKFLKEITPGMIVRPTEIAERFNISVKNVYIICEKYKSLRTILILYCPDCKTKLSSKRYYTIADLPNKDITCSYCKKDNNALRCACVFYEKT